MNEPEYLAVMSWCGFEESHPPHLWAEITRKVSVMITNVLLIMPCPGEPFPDEDEQG